MDSRGRAIVTLSGDLSGDYVVVEERPDGSVVLAPTSSTRSGGATRRPASNVGSLLSGLLSPSPRKRMTTEEILEEWGVQLREGELPGELFVADVDDKPGFVAITSQRFIFVANAGSGLTAVEEHLLSAARNVQVLRRGVRHKLRVTWHGTDSLIVTPDRKALERLQHHLERHAIA
jgi:hypothetical protein